MKMVLLICLWLCLLIVNANAMFETAWNTILQEMVHKKLIKIKKNKIQKEVEPFMHSLAKAMGLQVDEVLRLQIMPGTTVGSYIYFRTNGIDEAEDYQDYDGNFLKVLFSHDTYLEQTIQQLADDTSLSGPHFIKIRKCIINKLLSKRNFAEIQFNIVNYSLHDSLKIYSALAVTSCVNCCIGIKAMLNNHNKALGLSALITGIGGLGLLLFKYAQKKINVSDLVAKVDYYKNLQKIYDISLNQNSKNVTNVLIKN